MEIGKFAVKNRIKGAIFDMDGTLTDSMSKWSEIYAALFKNLHIAVAKDFLMRFNHVSMRETVRILIREFDIHLDENEVYDSWLKSALTYYEKVFKVKSYMLETLKEFDELGIKCGLATASDRACAEIFIKSNNLTKYIRSVTVLDEVSRSKGFPDIYLKAADKLCLIPCECLVFEDALIAIKSAKQGGFAVCGVQDDCSLKDRKEIKDLSDFTLGF